MKPHGQVFSRHISCGRSFCAAWTCCVAALLGQPLLAEVTRPNTFREILELAEIGPDALAQLGADPATSEDDWRLLLQVFARWQQFRDLDPLSLDAASLAAISPADRKSRLCETVHVRGDIVSVTKCLLPEKLLALQEQKSIYRCQLRLLMSEGQASSGATLLTLRIPQAWLTKKNFQETVQIRGVLVQFSAEKGEPLILTDHIAWYPQDGVPTGQLLLARYGMDVALLEEVRHKRPFVKPEISREGEAFYATLQAFSQVKPQELFQRAQENVALVAARWRARQAEFQREHQGLEAKLTTTTDGAARQSLQKQIEQAKSKRGLAAAVLKQAEAGRSSVAPMFLQPEKEVGELLVIEGMARRAVRVDRSETDSDEAASDKATGEKAGNLEEYYELEVFTSDSQNLPIVCCVVRLPEGFPIGDEIRAPVRLSGVFFKLWRYRSRQLVESAGETTRQRQLYTPVVLGHMPTWLKRAAHRDSRWAFWGGIAFLSVLVTLWICLAWLARSDHQARLRRTETIDLQ